MSRDARAIWPQDTGCLKPQTLKNPNRGLFKLEVFQLKKTLAHTRITGSPSNEDHNSTWSHLFQKATGSPAACLPKTQPPLAALYATQDSHLAHAERLNRNWHGHYEVAVPLFPVGCCAPVLLIVQALPAALDTGDLFPWHPEQILAAWVLHCKMKTSFYSLKFD